MIELKGILLVNSSSQNKSIKQCLVKPTKATQSLFGTRQYYAFRYWDFRWRHVGCSHLTPPEYYYGPTINGKPDFSKSYGYKYCAKFEDETYKVLSNKGKIWLQNTKLNLQKYLEQGLLNEKYFSRNFPMYNRIYNFEGALTGIELDNDKFQDFAFATHPDAYIDAGMLELGLVDLWYIGNTPELTEFREARTQKQVMLVVEKFIIKYITIPFTWPTEKLIEAGENVKQVINDKANEIFTEMISSISSIIREKIISEIKNIIDKYKSPML